MKIIGVIPARFKSSRFPGKPLADICGKPMIWWVYKRAKEAKDIDDIIVATESELVKQICEKYGMQCIMTSSEHTTPTSRIYEVSTKKEYEYYAFISGDEPLIDPALIDKIAIEVKKSKADAVNAMKKIDNIAEAIDPTNIKVVTDTDGYLMYVSRYPIPFPKGRLDTDYILKFLMILKEVNWNKPKSVIY